jgi:hypothetical protein
MKMRNIVKITFAVCLLFLFSCSNRPVDQQKEENTKTEKVENIIPEFRIDFPKTNFKVEKTEKRDTSFNNLLITNWVLEGEDENGPFLYFIAHNKFPEELLELEKTDSNSLNVALKAMLAGPATKLGGTDFGFKEIKYRDYIGMESICKVFKGNGILKSRVYYINNDLFMMSAGGFNISIDSVDKFLNSFELIEQ